MNDEVDGELARYARQVQFAPLGETGQRRLMQGRALICGCGGLGSAAAHILARAGVGLLRIVDRDFVDLNNIHRQSLYDEADAARGLPKAVAAAERLRAINSGITIEPLVANVTAANVLELCQDMDVIVDGTDNFETRFLLNDAAVSRGLPWVYGGCVGAAGQAMTIIPGRTPCLRCLLPECPAPGSTPTGLAAGILMPIVGAIAAIEAMEAIKILAGRADAVRPGLAVLDLWEGRLRTIDLSGLRRQSDCPTCQRREFPWLAGVAGA